MSVQNADASSSSSGSNSSFHPSLRSRTYVRPRSSSSNDGSVTTNAWSSSPFSVSKSKWKGKARAVEDVEGREIPRGQRRRRMETRRRATTPNDGLEGLRRRDERKRLEARQEGPGGQEGMVLPMRMIGSGLYEVSYMLPVTVGREDSPQTFLLQVDSGSSDLWIASTSCGGDSCARSGSKFYDPVASGAVDTGIGFDIDYLRGHVEGPVYWDRVVVGGYSIENQALAAANIVREEPLADNFNGIIGLALPLNSVISQRLPAGTTNDPDGAAWASNLFSITPVVNAPGAWFIGMTLARPGSDRVPSLLTIGRHPTNDPTGVVKEEDVARIQYSTLVSERVGTLFWKTSLREIVVWVNGEPQVLDLPRSGTGTVFPTAILDSGIPLIFTTSAIANAIYGAIGISPSPDGQYFVPCDTPLNITVRLDDRRSVPLHPLDLTAPPGDDNRAKFCVGLIQPADGALGGRDSVADVVLGVPFLRNVYHVMAYTQPNADGSFPNVNAPTSPTDDPSETISIDPTIPPIPTNQVAPRLGILGITDPTIALEEFKTVRLLNQPISNSPNGGSNANSNAGAKKEGGLNTGIIVAIALVSFFGACAALWILRWFLHRRRDRLAGIAAVGALDAKRRSKKGDDDAWGDGDDPKEREMVLGSLYGAARTKGGLGGDVYALGKVRSEDKRSSGGSTSGGEKVDGGVNSASTLVAGNKERSVERERTVSDASTVDGSATAPVAAGAAVGAAALASSRSRQELANRPMKDESYRGHRPRVDSETLPPGSPDQSVTAQLLDEVERERNRSPERAPHHRTTSSTAAPLLMNDWQHKDDGGYVPTKARAVPPLSLPSNPKPMPTATIAPPPPALTPLTPQTTASIVSPAVAAAASRNKPSNSNKGILRPRDRPPATSPVSPPSSRPGRTPGGSGSVGNSEDLWGAPSPPPVNSIKKMALEDQKIQSKKGVRGRSRSGSGGKRSSLRSMVVVEEPEEEVKVPPLPSVGR